MIEPEGTVSPYESATILGVNTQFGYLPEKHQKRAEAYKKYDQLYWNEREAYTLRIVEDEEPIYVPNPRTVVDTTAHFYLKGLRIVPKDAGKDSALKQALEAFLDRETFYARFQSAKHAGVARGDYAFHMTADPNKPEGRRLSLTPLQPWKVILEEDPDDSTRVTAAMLVEAVPHPEDEAKSAIRVLRYDYGIEGEESTEDAEGNRQVWREEAIWSTDQPWWDGDKRELVQDILPREMLPPPISTIPVYFFNNIVWDNGLYGVSDLRGFESISRGISQTATDNSTALSLEGLGAYATDGGKPVDNNGRETDWEVSPGKVVEVPQGSYFRRIEGVGSIKPSMDHIEYLESKIREAGGLSDVALGRVDVQTAQSGIALAIKFMPTLAKLETRNEVALGKLKQMFHDWKLWHEAYEGKKLEGEIVATVGDMLPLNRTERVNELNNMLDRKVISRNYYRSEMQQLGYTFPDDIEEQIQDEAQREAELKAQNAPPGLEENAEEAARGGRPPPEGNQPGVRTRRRRKPNRSNNSGRPNESSGTEATQSLENQSGDGKSLVNA